MNSKQIANELQTIVQVFKQITNRYQNTTANDLILNCLHKNCKQIINNFKTIEKE